jgi:hypothetical protein
MKNADKCEDLKLVEMDISLLFNRLLEADKPLMESSLLKSVTNVKHLPSGPQKLFTYHFSLFSLLYQLKEMHGPQGYYFHFDPMRIRMVKIPGSGHCHHYNPERGAFCGEETAESLYCSLHLKSARPEEKCVSFDPLHDFYTNPENICFCREEIFEKLVKGFVFYSMRKGAVDDALKFFSLTRPTRKIIIKKYHQLARKMHPDLKNGDETLMKKLNSSYQVLMEVFVV